MEKEKHTMTYENALTFEISLRGCEFEVSLEYNFESGNATRTDPSYFDIDLGDIWSLKTLKPVSKRLSVALMNEYEEYFTDCIYEQHQ